MMGVGYWGEWERVGSGVNGRGWGSGGMGGGGGVG